MSSDTNSLAHTKWNCKYHIVFENIETSDIWKIKRYGIIFASIM